MNQAAKYPDGASLAVTFAVVANCTDGVDFHATLTLANHGDVSLPGAGWAIYFNFPRKIVVEDEAAGAAIAHVNGDLMKLEPRPGFGRLPPGESRVIALAGDGGIISETDAPGGFFIVYGDGSVGAAAEPFGALTIAPFEHPAQLTCRPRDIIPSQTPALRLEQDKDLSLLPEASVGRITPTPLRWQATGDHFTLTAGATIGHVAAFAREAAFLRDRLASLLTAVPVLAPESEGAVALRLDPALADPDAYRLTVRTVGVEIAAAAPAGIFRGIQSLLQLLPVAAWRGGAASLEIGGCMVEDRPRFAYRGMHLDVGRNFSDKGTVLRLLDLMALYKLNKLHFHLTDDEGWRLEIAALPELTQMGARRGFEHDEVDCLMPSFGSGPVPGLPPGSGHYTRQDFVEILRYADARHIEIIPEIDLPGHARAAIKAMELRHRRLVRQGKVAEAEAYLLSDPEDRSVYESVQRWNDNVVCVARESCYAFIELVLVELVQMYREAGLALKNLHTGGDEFPAGAWEKSPICRRFMQDHLMSGAHELRAYFFQRLQRLVTSHGIVMAGWEEVALTHPKDGTATPNPAFIAGGFLPYVWNNVWGWGQEDIAYRLANLGYEVVLCNVTNLYLDLAYEKDPHEPGYYWGGFIDTRRVYEFCPLDIYTTAVTDVSGHKLDPAKLAGKARLTPDGEARILGIQGQLWGENIRDRGRAEYMLMPRLAALAERAWAADPGWTKIADKAARDAAMARDWNEFANRLGQRELPRLDHYLGGVAYRVPVPGAEVRRGMLVASLDAPGLALHYTLDGSEPGPASPRYQGPVAVAPGLEIRIAGLTTTGRRGRAVLVRS